MQSCISTGERAAIEDATVKIKGQGRCSKLLYDEPDDPLTPKSRQPLAPPRSQRKKFSELGPESVV